MRIRTTPLFQSQKRGLRKSQVRELDQQIQGVLENPSIGQPGEEELEEVYYHRYEDKYGRMLLAYKVQEKELWLLAVAQISLKI